MSEITFDRLSSVPLEQLVLHMSDPRLTEHMPLLSGEWYTVRAAEFVTFKEGFWERDGLGHWAIYQDGLYVGWGGFQREGDEWDFGLVLHPDHFGLGVQITQQAVAYAKGDPDIPFITFLLPPSRKNLGALRRLGAEFVGEIDYGGETFRKYKLLTS